MGNSMRNANDASDRPPSPPRDQGGRGFWSPTMVSGVAIWGIIYVLSVYFARKRGQAWLSALTFDVDRDFVPYMVDFGVPVAVTIVLLYTVRKLPPGRERTTLTWVGWAVYVFLFVWWSPLRDIVAS